MGLSQRTGLFGTYWGNDYNSSNALTQSQMEENATYICLSLLFSGWTKEAIAGMLGNMQTESSINPGRWEGNNVGVGPGYGLVQWTPYTKYTDWCTGDPSTMDNNLSRINYEVENGLQWIPTEEYPMSFASFKTSTDNPYTLAMAFLRNYERPAEPNQPQRGEQALAWYEYLTGITPVPPYLFGIKKKGFNFVLFKKKRRIKNGQRNIFK